MCHGQTDGRTDRITISISRVSSSMLTRDKNETNGVPERFHQDAGQTTQTNGTSWQKRDIWQWQPYCHVMPQTCHKHVMPQSSCLCSAVAVYYCCCYKDLVNAAKEKMNMKQSLSPVKVSRQTLLTSAHSVVEDR